MITLHLLGPFEIQLPSGQAPKLGRKTRALLAYLAATAEIHSRRHLMEMFCQEAADPAGALRWHLSRIRRQVAENILLTEQQQISLALEDVQCDHLGFQQWLSKPGQQTTPYLSQACALYRGEFLVDLHLRDAPTFEMWLLAERARYRQLYENGVQELIERLIQTQAFTDAIGMAKTLLQSNPLLETVHSQLIWLYAQTGQRQSALQQFAHCQAILQEELAVSPAPELLALHQKILHKQPLPDLHINTTVPPSQTFTATAVSNFVGREAEKRQLQTFWHKGGQVLLVEAEAGGGKTRLIEAFCQTLPASLVRLTGHSYESTRTVPYQPWLSILEKYAGQQTTANLQKIAPHWQQQLSLLLPDIYRKQQIEGLNQQQLFHAIAHFFNSLQPQQPLLIWLEDLQWADEASLQLFQFFAHHLLARPRFLLIGTFRSEEIAENSALSTLLYDLGRLESVLRLALLPLSAAEVEQLIALLWPDLPPSFRVPHIRDMLWQATGGNPLFTTEILNELASAAELPANLPIPPSLVELTNRRLQQLPASSRQVIESLAVLERPAHFDLVQHISARTEEETLTAVEMGLRWRLLQPNEGIQVDFSHDLLRTAVVAQLSAIRRTILHRRAAQTLQHWGADAATLAHHWQQAGDDEQEAHFAALAGAEAATLFAHDEAAHYLERALNLNQNAEQRLALLLKIGRIYEIQGKWDEAEAMFKEGLATAVAQENQSVQVECLIALGWIETDRGEFDTAVQQFQQAYDLAEPAGQSKAMGGLGVVHLYQSQLEQALAYFEQQKALQEQLNDQLGLGKTMANIGIVYAHQADYAQAQAAMEIYFHIANAQNSPRDILQSATTLASVHQQQGHYQQAIAYWEDVVTLAEKLGDMHGLGMAIGNIGQMFMQMGFYEGAWSCFLYSLARSLEVGDQRSVAIGLGRLGKAALRQASLDLAEQLLTTALQTLRQMNIPYNLCEVLEALTELAWQQNDWQTAVPLAAETLQIAQKIERKSIIFTAQLYQIRLAVQLAKMDRDTAVAALEAMLPHWPETAQQARLNFEMVQLKPTLTEPRQQAAALYAQAYAATPHIEYRSHYHTLTGISLPPPAPIPIPAAAANAQLELAALLEQVV